MRVIRSISSELSPLALNPVFRNDQDLELVTSVYVSLGSRLEGSVH